MQEILEILSILFIHTIIFLKWSHLFKNIELANLEDLFGINSLHLFHLGS